MTPEAALKRYRPDLRRALSRDGRAHTAMRPALNGFGAAALNADNEEVMVFSDLHLGHADIIRHAGRPFEDLDEMGGTLWHNWHRTVAPNAVLVCVGDVALGDGVSPATWKRIREAPGRRKVLVIGNHDLSNDGRLRTKGFDEAYALLVSDGDPPLIWTHAPLSRVPAGHVNVHGHLHARQRARSPHINVSVEQLAYRPISLARLRLLAQAIVADACPEGRTTLERVVALESR